jgi:hypothetical protein
VSLEATMKADKKNKNQNPVIHVKVPQRLYNDLKVMANDDLRTVSSLVIKILTERVQAMVEPIR